MYKLSKYIVFTELNNKNKKEDQLLYLYSTINQAKIIIKKKDFEQINCSNFSKIDVLLFNKLKELKFVVESINDNNDFIEILDFLKSDKKTLGIVLHSSANCQFGCNYCGQSHLNKNIDSITIENTKNFVDNKLKSNNYNFLNIVWHGAEPLLGVKELQVLSKYFIDLTNKYSVDYNAKIITNGLGLKLKIFQNLYENCKINKFQITLDGDKEYHDKKRFLKAGGETFDIIFKNLCEIKNNYLEFKNEINLIFDIRINIDSLNIDGIIPLIEKFSKNNFQKFVNFSFRTVENYSENKSKSKSGINAFDFSKYEIDFILYAIECGFRINNILPERINTTCLATLNDSFSMDINGNMFSCYTFPYTKHDLSDVNKIGNINEPINSHNFKNLQLKNFYIDIENKKVPCYDCNLLPVCGGYCPLKWYEGEVACPSFKYNIEDRLILDYLENHKND